LDTPPPLKGEPTFMPSICTTPSLDRPPLAVKKFVDVATPVLKPVAWMAGKAAR
jgi:hypothetical protein